MESVDKFLALKRTLSDMDMMDKLESFQVVGVDDACIQLCFDNPKICDMFENIIPLVGKRMELLAKFRANTSLITNQEKPIELSRRGFQMLVAKYKCDMSALVRPSLVGLHEFLQLHEQLLEEIAGEFMAANSQSSLAKSMEKSLRKEMESLKDTLWTDIESNNDQLINTHGKNAAGKAMQTYNQKMTEMSEKSDPILDSVLANIHESSLEKANEALERSFKDLPEEFRDDNLENQTTLGLLKEIEGKLNDFKKENEVRWNDFEKDLEVELTTAQEDFERDVLSLMKDVDNPQELEKALNDLSGEHIDGLRTSRNWNSVRPAILDRLITKLCHFTAKHCDEVLRVSYMQKRINDLKLKQAFSKTKDYYNDQMRKFLNQHPWIFPDELQAESDKIMDNAIHRYKDQFVEELSEKQNRDLKGLMKVLFAKFQEENFKNTPNETNPFSVGIDLGTTYSCVAVYYNKTVKIIECQGGTTIPSVVCFRKDGFAGSREIVVGKVAQDNWSRYPQYTVYDAKRLIGRLFREKTVQEQIKSWSFKVVAGKDDQAFVSVGEEQELRCRPEEISAKVLATLKQAAEKFLKKQISKAVVTVPAYFSNAQKIATKDAARIAGLDVQLLDEPTAAAIAYGLHTPDDLRRNILVFDLGGGTFDVAILAIDKCNITVKAKGGDTHLGGRDFDREMVKHIIQTIRTNNGIDLDRDLNSEKSKQSVAAFERLVRLLQVCETQKRNLSFAETVDINLVKLDGDFDLFYKFTRSTFERINQVHFDKCIDHVDSTLKSINMRKEEIDDIVLVGGSTRIPKIRQMLQEYFEHKKQFTDTINPDESVAYGAAVKAAVENGKQAMDLRHAISLGNVTPLSIGIEDYFGKHVISIPRHTSIPCRRKSIWYTAHDNQTQVSFEVYEGEKPKAKDNNFLGEFVIENVPPAPRGKEKFDVDLRLNEEGILHVKAINLSTGNNGEITIENYNGRMTDLEIGIAKVK